MRPFWRSSTAFFNFSRNLAVLLSLSQVRRTTPGLISPFPLTPSFFYHGIPNLTRPIRDGPSRRAIVTPPFIFLPTPVAPTERYPHLRAFAKNQINASPFLNPPPFARTSSNIDIRHAVLPRPPPPHLHGLTGLPPGQRSTKTTNSTFFLLSLSQDFQTCVNFQDGGRRIKLTCVSFPDSFLTLHSGPSPSYDPLLLHVLATSS